jgi:hypothetical protein
MSKMTDVSVLRKNIEWNLSLMIVQIHHAGNVKTRARSGYYKMAYIIGASIVEALVHAILRKHLGENGVLDLGEKETYECSALPASYYPKDEILVIAKQRDVVLPINKNPDFGKMNKACLRSTFISRRLFQRVEKIRKNRNKLHLQGVLCIDRSYTLKDVKDVSDAVDQLIRMAF